MIDIRLLEKDEKRPSGKTFSEEYRECLKNRKGDPAAVDRLLELNKIRKKFISEAESRKAEQNKFGPLIAQKKKNKENADVELAAMQKLAQEGKEFELKAQQAEVDVQALLQTLPNMVHASVPVGTSEHDNAIVHTWGEARKFSFKPKEHWDIHADWIDFERAGKVAGARFAFLRGPVARLERALLNFMLDMHTSKHGYEEIMSPYMVNARSMFGTGNFPKFYDDVFHLVGTDYHLIPTAEVPVTNFYAEEILSEEQLPVCFSGFTPCFRSEAGSYGRDTKGLIRQHQFHKVELVKFSHPSKSYEDHETLTQNAEAILKALELPFQRVALCTGDIGFGSAKTFDLNVWLPSQNAYREISSCSNFEDFQARRANIRFRSKGGGKPEFVHTINGSGLAIGRTTIAVLENYQNEDGSVTIPKALVPFMDGVTRIGGPA